MCSFPGTQRETYLEFQKKLKIKKRSDFSLEVKADADGGGGGDGVIFYVADDTHTDFIALFIKDGKVQSPS